MDYVIETKGLTKEFGTLRAVDSLDLHVRPGGVYGFLGPNGSGKTTTIRLLLGLLRADAGTARVLGYDVSCDGDAVRASCGALLEHDGLYERLSAEANLDLMGRIWRMERRARDRRTREMLEGLRLWDRRHDPVGEWSRGMKRKLAVARALYARPRLVFLDEPTAGLDPVASAAFIDTLRDLVARDETSVFLTTHDLSDAEHLCDAIGVLRDGRLVAQGTPAEIRALAGGLRVEIVVEQPPAPSRMEELARSLAGFTGVREVALVPTGLTLWLDRGTSTAPLVRFLVEQGIQVEEARKGTATLAEAFLALVDSEGDQDVA